jgi:Leucine-rich repeat (LRR) protein
MESLTELDASYSQRGRAPAPIESLAGLQTAKNIVELKLSGKSWDSSYPNLSTSDLSPLAGLSQLRSLDLGNNNLTSVTLPDGLTSLQDLGLGPNPLTSLILPNELTCLTRLSLWGTALTDLSFLANLTSLQDLNLGANQLTSLTLPGSLTTLTLQWARFTNSSFLEGLTNLESLDISLCELTRFTVPEGLTSLATLDVRENPLLHLAVPVGTDLSHLEILGFPKDQVSFHAGFIKVQEGDLQWTQGTLQSSPFATGPWSDLPVASPMPLSPIGEQGFFRVKVEE